MLLNAIRMPSIVLALFVILRFIEVIRLSWWVVLAPLYVGAILVAGAFILHYIILIYLHFKDKK